MLAIFLPLLCLKMVVCQIQVYIWRHTFLVLPVRPISFSIFRSHHFLEFKSTKDTLAQTSLECYLYLHNNENGLVWLKRQTKTKNVERSQMLLNIRIFNVFSQISSLQYFF